MNAKLYNLSLLNDLHDVKVTAGNVNYFRRKGYKCNIGEILEDIPLEKIPSNSKPCFRLMCSGCGFTSSVSYNTYEEVLSKNGEYQCAKCRSMDNSK